MLEGLPEKIISQCGLISGLLIIAVVWLALQLAKTRAGWEKDRSEMLEIIETQNASLGNISTSNARLEGVLLALGTKK